MPLLSYQYESSAIGSFPAAAAIRTKHDYQRLERRIRQGANIRFDIKQRIRIADRAAVSIAKPVSIETKLSTGDFATILNSDAAKERVFVSIDFAQLPASSDFAVRVFIDLPSANSSTPVDDPHFAGSFAFFGTSLPSAPAAAGVEHQGQTKFLVNITRLRCRNLEGLRSSRREVPFRCSLCPYHSPRNLKNPTLACCWRRLT